MKTGVNWTVTLNGWGWTSGSTSPSTPEVANIKNILERLATSEEDISMTIMSSLKTNVQLSGDGIVIPYRVIFPAAFASFTEHNEARIVPFRDTNSFAFELPIAIQLNKKTHLRYLKIKINRSDLTKIHKLEEACMSYHASDNYTGGGICQN